MRLLACADVHGDHEVYSWLAETARRLEPDALVLAGDLLGFPSGYQSWERAQEADARAIVGLLAPAGVAVYFVMGNHDRIMISSNSRTFVSLHERRIELGCYNLVGYAYSVRHSGGLFEKGEAEIAEDVGRLELWLDSNSVLVAHSPAWGILDLGKNGARIGSLSLAALLERRAVRAHVHGHSHEDFGRSDNRFNVACGRRKRAMVLDLESMTHDVVSG
jgi:Icc-related predicted phosphoesterase